MVRAPTNNNYNNNYFGMDSHYFNLSSQLQHQGEITSKKRNLHLDLSATKQPAKRGRFANLGGAPVLSSPDFQKLKLGSPDLEKILLENGALSTATPTPNTANILFPRVVTMEQEDFVNGFQTALSELQHSDSSQGGAHAADMRCESTSSGDSSEDYSLLLENSQGTTFSSGYGLVKEEQRVPSLCSSPPMSPINMESQEKIKLERKRQRNRLAASKCRRRKLERISKLEDKVKLLKNENSDLSVMVNKLKHQVCYLKEQVIEHARHGCEIGAPQFPLQ